MNSTHVMNRKDVHRLSVHVSTDLLPGQLGYGDIHCLSEQSKHCISAWNVRNVSASSQESKYIESRMCRSDSIPSKMRPFVQKMPFERTGDAP